MSDLMFVEELFPLVTLQTYPCNHNSISGTQKRHFTTTFGD